VVVEELVDFEQEHHMLLHLQLLIRLLLVLVVMADLDRSLLLSLQQMVVQQ
jgi:hypothetical protein